MDRSSFHRVITTDKENRIAFKESLRKKIQSHSESYDADSEYGSLPIGHTVWHPNFGVGEVVSVNKEMNEVVLDFGSCAVSFVLSQVLSKLSPVSASANLIPSPIRKVDSPQTPLKEKILPVLSVRIPDGFEKMKERDQFVYLKTELQLTIEQANDVLFAMKGQSPLYNKVIMERTC